MYPTIDRSGDFWYGAKQTSESLIRAIPTYENHLDSFFRRNSEAIIEEWGLVTEDDLNHLQKKIEYLSYEVGRLVSEKKNIETRVANLTSEILKLEQDYES